MPHERHPAPVSHLSPALPVNPAPPAAATKPAPPPGPTAGQAERLPGGRAGSLRAPREGAAFKCRLGKPPLTAHRAACRLPGPPQESGVAAPGGKGKAGTALWGTRRRPKGGRGRGPTRIAIAMPAPCPPHRTHHGEQPSFRRGAAAKGTRAGGGAGVPVPRRGGARCLRIHCHPRHYLLRA